MLRCFIVPLAGLWCLASSGASLGATEPPTLAEFFNDAAPQIINQLVGKKWQRAGVLKFLIQPLGGAPSDNEGELNSLAAKQLEVALNLALRDGGPIEIAELASLEADRLRVPTYATPDGRKMLMACKYASIDGDLRPRPVDGFVTGEIRLVEEARAMEVSLLAFDGNSVQPFSLIAPVRCRVTGENRDQMGKPSPVRGGVDEEAANKGVRPLIATEANNPFRLVVGVFEGSERVGITVTDGALATAEKRLFLPEPQKGGKITLRITRTDERPEVLGVVVKINGENTLPSERGAERMPNFYCSKWILRSGDSVPIKDLQVDRQLADGFQAAARARAQAPQNSMYFGSETGTINIAAYEVAKKEGSPVRDRKLEAIVKGAYPPGTFRSLTMLQETMLSHAGTRRSRGASGLRNGQPVDVDDYDVQPEPVVSVVIQCLPKK